MNANLTTDSHNGYCIAKPGRDALENIILEDETLRDGLQLEEKLLSLEQKIEILRLLVEAGVRRIQVGSFVHPKLMPQMADTDELISRIPKYPDLLITGLILNDKGLDRALKCGLGHVSMSVSASDTHSRKNSNFSAAEALASMTGLIKSATASGLDVRAGVQCAFGCVYEGKIQEDKVINAFEAMASAGAIELNMADTTGMANPKQISQMIRRLKEALPDCILSLHLHDTRGLGLANMFAGYEAGVRIFDVSTGGLGGCPFVKGAAGNVATEDAVNLFSQMNVKTGINLEKLYLATRKLEEILRKQLHSRIYKVFQVMGHV